MCLYYILFKDCRVAENLADFLGGNGNKNWLPGSIKMLSKIMPTSTDFSLTSIAPSTALVSTVREPSALTDTTPAIHVQADPPREV